MPVFLDDAPGRGELITAQRHRLLDEWLPRDGEAHMTAPGIENLMSHVEYNHVSVVTIGSHSGNVITMTTITTLAKFIESARIKAGMPSQTELARRAGVPRETVNRIERGLTQNPEADVRRRLAKALGVSHLDLLVAAGEITSDEIKAVGVEGVVERDPFPERERLLNRIRSLKWEPGVETTLEVTVRVLEELEREKGRG